MSGYRFRPLTEADLPMLAVWGRTPEVRAWWGELDGEEAIDAEDIADPRTRLWIVEHQGRPFAYLQDYDPHAWPGHPFAHLPADSRGLDQFIGVPHMLGRGHGSALVRQHVDDLFGAGVPAVGVDPHPDNARAIRAYQKAGFTAGETRDSDWGRCLLMTRTRP